MDISLDELPFIINACFVLINCCEANREIIADQTAAAALQYDRPPAINTATFSNNETKGSRNVFAKFFDP